MIRSLEERSQQLHLLLLFSLPLDYTYHTDGTISSVLVTAIKKKKIWKQSLLLNRNVNQTLWEDCASAEINILFRNAGL